MTPPRLGQGPVILAPPPAGAAPAAPGDAALTFPMFERGVPPGPGSVLAPFGLQTRPVPASGRYEPEPERYPGYTVPVCPSGFDYPLREDGAKDYARGCQPAKDMPGRVAWTMDQFGLFRPVYDAKDDLLRNIRLRRHGQLAYWPQSFFDGAAGTAFYHPYLKASFGWIDDRSLPAETAAAFVRNHGTLVSVYKEVPWPDDFFTGLLSPRDAHGEPDGSPMPPPFYRGWSYAYDLDKIAASDYFPRSRARVERDAAQFIVDHPDDLAAQLQGEVQYAQAKAEAHAARAQRIAKIEGIVFDVLGAVLGAVAGPVGGVLKAMTVVAKTAVAVVNVGTMGADARDAVGKIYAALGVPAERVEAFKTWILAKAARVPMPLGPPTPPGARGAYSVFIEGRYLASGDDPGDLAVKGMAASGVGDRIQVKSEATGELSTLVLHAEGDRAVVIPARDVAAALALPRQKAREAAGAGGRFPWGLVAAGAAVVLAS